MKIAAFQVFAALGANDEVIRKKIIDTKFLVRVPFLQTPVFK
jgi:hypothetical protein